MQPQSKIAHITLNYAHCVYCVDKIYNYTSVVFCKKWQCILCQFLTDFNKFFFALAEHKKNYIHLLTYLLLFYFTMMSS